MRKDDETFADDDETLKIYSYNISLTHRLRFCHGKIAITSENPQTESWKKHSYIFSSNFRLLYLKPNSAAQINFAFYENESPNIFTCFSISIFYWSFSSFLPLAPKMTLVNLLSQHLAITKKKIVPD